MSQSESKENIIVFTEETLQTCHTKKTIRDQSKKKKSKYDTIVLPEIPDGTVGYHASCYRYYCSVKAKNSESVEQKECKAHLKKNLFEIVLILIYLSSSTDNTDIVEYWKRCGSRE